MSRGSSSTVRRVAGIIIAAITMIVLIALLGVLSIMPGSKRWVDSVAATDNAIDQTVSPTQSETYCPAPMELADSGTYGDSAFQASVGNLSTQARYAAFGSVYSSTASVFAQDSSGDDVTLKDGDPGDDDAVKVGSQSIDQGARLIETHMLQAVAGTGTTGSIASWADDGDLKGVSAASCVSTALKQSFLLPGTGTGNTHQLIVANPSTKPTTVDIAIWGSKESGKLTMSTQSTLVVPARGENTLELSAAASNQDGLYVTVSSKETPIAAVVRSISMNGLTSKGSDFALPLGSGSNASAVSSITKDDAVTAYLFSKEDTNTELSWITEHGLVKAKDVTVKSGKVSVVDLDRAPDGALGVMSTAEDKVSFSIKASRSGDGDQADFALINAATPAAFSGLALPEGVDVAATLSNISNAEQNVTMHAYDDKGKALASTDVKLAANAAQKVDVKDLAGDDGTVAVLMVESENRKVSWSVRLGHKDLGDGKVAGLSSLDATALTPLVTHIWARGNDSIVR